MITKTELIEVLDIYITPLYKLIGAGVALLIIVFVLWLVIWPFLKKGGHR